MVDCKAVKELLLVDLLARVLDIRGVPLGEGRVHRDRVVEKTPSGWLNYIVDIVSGAILFLGVVPALS
jgi:hypothetical protein